MSERDRYGRDRDPFENLGDLIDEPVAPRGVFADELRSRLMRELSASDSSREEQAQPMDAVLPPRPPLAFPIESPRRIRPMVILELAAAAIIILGVAAALSRGWFQNEPDAPTSVPAVAQPGDDTPTPALNGEQTPTPASNSMAPTEAAEGSTPVSNSNDMIPTVSSEGSFEPTVVPPASTIPGTIWTLPGVAGENVEFGGMVLDDDRVYRLLASPSFVGLQLVDRETGIVIGELAHKWSGNLFTIEDGTLYFDGGENQLVAIDADTGAEWWSAKVAGNPIALDVEDDIVYVLLDTDFVTAIDAETGDQRWVAQGQVPQNPTGGSTSMPAIGKIAEENGVVAAISSYGVLSGFDAETGKELWAHEGYDAATVSIDGDNDVFVVTGFLASTPMVPNGSPVAIEEGVALSLMQTIGTCALDFGGTTGTAATPEAGAQGSVNGSAGFVAQVIDAKTGEIRTDPASVGEHGITAACGIDIGGGQLAIDPTQDVVAVGMATGTEYRPEQGLQDADGTIILIAGSAGTDSQVIAAVADDDEVYLQLEDGSLVRVAGKQVHHEDGHQEASDDDHSDDNTSESDDD